MPIVSIAMWPSDSETVRTLLVEVTDAVQRVTGAPRDKITVYIDEVAANRWATAGVPGGDPGLVGDARAVEG